MYIYFDTNGTIKEVINDESIRRGSSDYNKIYCYLEGNPDIDDIWYLQKNPDGTLTNEVSFVDNIVTKAIPYDAKRDMKYFQDFEEYQFYVFTLSSSYLSQNGLVVATIRVAENNTLWALGELTFNVQENVINSDNDITQSQYDYLLLAYASRTLNEQTGSDLDHLLDEKIEAKANDIIEPIFNDYKSIIDEEVESQNETIASLKQASPRVFDTASNILALTENKGIAVAIDTGYIYYWDSTLPTPAYVSSGLQYNSLADYVKHNGNQLQDENGNNIYPNIMLNSFDSVLKSILIEKVNNIVRTSSNNNAALNISGVVTPVSPSYHTNVYDVGGENIIYVNATTLYPNPNYCDYCFTDENDTIISYYQNGTKGVAYSLDTFINVPSNAKYFKLSIVNSTFGNEQVLSLIKISQKLNKDIYDKLINDSFTNVNLYDKYNTNDGYSLSGGNGALVADTNRLVTDFIEVDYTKSLYAIGGSPTSIVCLYNENKSFARTLIYNLNGQTPSLIDLSSYSNCRYIRISIELTYKDSFILSEFTTNYPYGNQCIKLQNIENASNILLNHWMGKKGDSLGDSITAQGYYQKAVSSILNLDMYYNHGIGGTKVTGNDTNSMHKDVRINALNENADFITIMGGTNDSNVSIGDITLSNIDTDTYVGALNTIISKIYYKYAHTSINNGVDYSGITQTTNAKNIKIFVMTPTFTGTDSTGRFINQSNAIRELCKLWGIPVIDLSGKSGMNFGTINYCFNGTDLVHPIEQCHYNMIAPVIVNELLDNPIVNYDNVKISKRFA